METYRPGEQRKKPVPQSGGAYLYNDSVVYNPTGYFSAPRVEANNAGSAQADQTRAMAPGGFEADDALNNMQTAFGAASGVNNGFDANDPFAQYMNMNQGFEAGVTPAKQLTGIRHLSAIAGEEVVAKSFIFMFAALIITTVAALTTSPATAMFFFRGYNYWIFVAVELAIVMGANWAAARNKGILAGVLFAAYSYMTGVLFSILFEHFHLSSIVSIFGGCAVMFGAFAIFGLVTKRDLTSAGSLCMMALFGIIIVSIFNSIFIKSSGLDYVVSAIGVLVFVGLTAYDAQKIKKLAETATPQSVMSVSMIGALELYLDFINLFLRLLRLFGKRK